MAPLVSVIVVSFNTCALTLACIESLVSQDQDCFDLEIIVVDNASSDDTLACLKAKFPSTKVILNSKNIGFARGSNLGFEMAQGKYLYALNSDTESLQGSIAALVSFMETHPQAGACGPMLLNSDQTIQPSGRALPTLLSVFMDMTKLYRLFRADVFSQRGRNYEQVLQVGEISGAALFVRSSIFRAIGGFDEKFFAYYEDVDWCKRINTAGHSIFYVPTARVIHHWRGTSRQVSELSYRAGQWSQRYYFRKHHGVLAGAIVQFMLLAKEFILFFVALVKLNETEAQLHSRMFLTALMPL